MLWHKLRHLVNNESQKQIKLDDMHVAHDPNNDKKEEDTPSTGNTHWQRTQVRIWAWPAWMSRQHGLWKGGVSHTQMEIVHTSWSQMTRQDARPEKHHQPRDWPSVSEVAVFLVCLPLDFLMAKQRTHMPPPHFTSTQYKKFLIFVNSMMSVVSLTL